MANYLQDGVGAFPQEQGFTPNYNFIMRTLEMRQNQYDQGFANVKSTYNSVLNSELLRTSNKETRDQILDNAQKALKDLPTIDLGIPKNVTAAQSVFKPFYENDNILNDMVFTKAIKGQISQGMSLQNSSKEEDRKRFWTTGVQDLYDSIDDFKNATDQEALGMQARHYVAKPQVSEEILKMFNSGKLKRTVDKISGQIKYTNENGSELEIPLENLYLAMAENNPETMEGFSVWGRVQRNKFIKDNTTNGRYATKELAAEAHDKSLINDYVGLQDRGIKLSTESLEKVNTRLKGWNEKLNNGLIAENSEDAQSMAYDENLKDDLEKRISIYNTNKQNASNTILRNPSQYLGDMYLHKSARDLSQALSAVTGSSKIDSNPLYKDFIFPKEMEVFRTNEQIRLEREKSALDMIEEEQKSTIDEANGKTSKSTTKNKESILLNNLNIPEVKENTASSGVTSYYKNTNLPDAYDQNIKSKLALVNKVIEERANYVFDVLDPNEIIDDKGKVMDQNEIRSLLNNPTLTNSLYAKAVNKAKSYENSNPQKYIQLLQKQERITNVDNAFLAHSQQQKKWTKEIVDNLAATETRPNETKEVTVTSQNEAIGGVGGSTVPVSSTTYKTKEIIPGGGEGWIYPYLISPTSGALLNEGDADKFIQSIQKDKKYDEKIKNTFSKNLEDYIKNKYIPGNIISNIVNRIIDPPTYEQAKTQVTVELKDKFIQLRDKVITKWNERGLNFENKYSILPGGGGITAKELTWRASNNVNGEMADVITGDLLTKISAIGGSDNLFVIQGPNAPNKSKKDGDDELLKLVQNGNLSNEIMNAIKLGKDAELKNYSISSSMVGGNDPNYHAYTLTFDNDFIAKMKGTDTKEGPLGETADKLVNGITIFIKKDKDLTLANSRSTMSEIDILVNTNPQGKLDREISRDYNLSIQKNPISGEYKLKTTILELSKDNLNGTPKEFTMTVPPGTDLSSFYYETLSELQNIFAKNQMMKSEYVKNLPDDKKATRESINQIKERIKNGQ